MTIPTAEDMARDVQLQLRFVVTMHRYYEAEAYERMITRLTAQRLCAHTDIRHGLTGYRCELCRFVLIP